MSLYERGYIASPNYPNKYFPDGDCVWHVTVQRRQNIVITLCDFELAVKRNARCYDFLDITATPRGWPNSLSFPVSGSTGSDVVGSDEGGRGGDSLTLFRECGLQGKMRIVSVNN